MVRKSQAPLITSPSRYEGAISQSKIDQLNKSSPHIALPTPQTASTGYEADLEPTKPMIFSTNGSSSKAHLLSSGGNATPLLSPEITSNMTSSVVFDIKREYEKQD
jgi:hypothetical protein